MKKVAIIDHRLSNLFSVNLACKKVGINAFIASTPSEINKADGLILPGVGAFQTAMDNLDSSGMTDSIHSFVEAEKPFFGICLGLQLLFSESSEFGTRPGLDIIKGKIKRFPSPEFGSISYKVPQIAWNRIMSTSRDFSNSPLMSLDDGEFMYFVHSYYAEPDDDQDTLLTTNYGAIKYCSGVLKNNIFAVQFHPEKSGSKGIRIYDNWARSNNLI